jgi:RNA-binding protein
MPLMPAGELRRALRAHGHAMSPIVQVGKAGVTEGLIKQVNQALADHELIKVKVGGECPQDRHEVGDLLDQEPGVDLVQIVGRVLLLYKRHPQKPRYEGKRAKSTAKSADKPGADRPSAVKSTSAPRSRSRRPPRSRK